MQRFSTDAKIAALLAVAVVLIFSDVLFLGSGFYIRDIYRDYLPSRFILRSAFLGGEFPMWNRFWSGGQPLAANPGFQAFYPGTWLAFLPSFFFGFNLEIVAHVALAAIGMFFCCDRWRCGWSPRSSARSRSDLAARFSRSRTCSRF